MKRNNDWNPSWKQFRIKANTWDANKVLNNTASSCRNKHVSFLQLYGWFCFVLCCPFLSFFRCYCRCVCRSWICLLCSGCFLKFGLLMHFSCTGTIWCCCISCVFCRSISFPLLGIYHFYIKLLVARAQCDFLGIILMYHQGITHLASRRFWLHLRNRCVWWPSKARFFVFFRGWNTRYVKKWTSWWLNHPIEQYATVKLDHLPRGEHKKWLKPSPSEDSGDAALQ